jgi:hypothetical protein
LVGCTMERIFLLDHGVPPPSLLHTHALLREGPFVSSDDHVLNLSLS